MVGLNAVVVAVTDGVPWLTVVGDGLPFATLDPAGDPTLERGLRRMVGEQTGLHLGYVEQLYTFGDRDRDPSGRVVSVAYLALVREQPLTRPEATWVEWYAALPWEDWRRGRPPVLDTHILPRLAAWADAGGPARAARRERVGLAFGQTAPWDGERALDRYELLYESALVAEGESSRPGRPRAGRPEPETNPGALGTPLRLDHRRIAATALSRLRGKLRYRPVVFELLPPTFTLLHLQRVVEALAGMPLHKQNFRRFLDREGLVEGTGEVDPGGRGRPAELFRFRADVVRHRPSIGVTVPVLRPLADRPLYSPHGDLCSD